MAPTAAAAGGRRAAKPAAGRRMLPRSLAAVALLSALLLCIGPGAAAAAGSSPGPGPGPRGAAPDPAWISPADVGVRIISIDNFTEVVVSSRDVWFLKFYSPRCETCKELEPVWEAAIERFGPRAMFGTVNIDTKPGKELAQQVGALELGVPTVRALVRHGRPESPRVPMIDILAPADGLPTVEELEGGFGAVMSGCPTRGVRGPPAPLPGWVDALLEFAEKKVFARAGVRGFKAAAAPRARAAWDAVARVRPALLRLLAPALAEGPGGARVFLKRPAPTAAEDGEETLGTAGTASDVTHERDPKPDIKKILEQEDDVEDLHNEL